MVNNCFSEGSENDGMIFRDTLLSVAPAVKLGNVLVELTTALHIYMCVCVCVCVCIMA